jgi:hypothetical protein
MRLYIPEIGDRLRLTSEWTFKLYREHRNKSLRTHFGLDSSTEVDEVTIPSGTVLKVDRIYIRSGASDYSSLSFYAEGIGKGSGAFGKPTSARFWAKLENCNQIEFEIEELKSETPKQRKVFIGSGRYVKFEDMEGYWTHIVYFDDDKKQENPLFEIFPIKEKVEYQSNNFWSGKKYYYSTKSYELKDMEGNLIKSYKSYDSLKSYLRTWAKKQNGGPQ